MNGSVLRPLSQPAARLSGRFLVQTESDQAVNREGAKLSPAMSVKRPAQGTARKQLRDRCRVVRLELPVVDQRCEPIGAVSFVAVTGPIEELDDVKDRNDASSGRGGN